MAMNLTQYRTVFRQFLKDHKDLNRLLNFSEENIDSYLDMYLEMALGFLNTVPPYLSPYSISDFPIPTLLIHQAVIEALISNSVLSSRNDLTYNNGGITVQAQNANRYSSVLQLLLHRSDMEIRYLQQLKISININNGWGHSSSPYLRMHTDLSLVPNTML
jgi:hypothetical protein